MFHITGAGIKGLGELKMFSKNFPKIDITESLVKIQN